MVSTRYMLALSYLGHQVDKRGGDPTPRDIRVAVAMFSGTTQEALDMEGWLQTRLQPSTTP